VLNIKTFFYSTAFIKQNFTLKDSDSGVEHSEVLGFWTLSAVWNSKYKKTQLVGHWISFRPQVMEGDTYSVGSIRKS
jgi:hypothetical protein